MLDLRTCELHCKEHEDPIECEVDPIERESEPVEHESIPVEHESLPFEPDERVNHFEHENENKELIYV